MAEVWGWESFFQELELFLVAANQGIITNSVMFAQYVQERLRICVQALSNMLAYLESTASSLTGVQAEVSELMADLFEIRDCCAVLQGIWDSRLDEIDSESSGLSSRFQVLSIRSSTGGGRPQFLITEDQLTYLRSLNFSWTHIADLLGVSRMTVYRRRRDFRIVDSEYGNQLADAELVSLLQQLRQSMPNMGETLILGHLRSLGYKVSRQKVRNAIHITDPLNTTLRWRGILTARRPYSVPAPNSLWHLGEHAY